MQVHKFKIVINSFTNVAQVGHFHCPFLFDWLVDWLMLDHSFQSGFFLCIN